MLRHACAAPYCRVAKVRSPVSPRSLRAAGVLAALALFSGPSSACALGLTPTRAREWVAGVIFRTVPRAAPGANARPLPTIFPVSQWGTPTELLVLGAHLDARGMSWLRVLVDDRPNGTAVWLNANDVVVHADTWRVVVSRAQREVWVFRDGRIVRSFLAVVGKPSTPTPAGRFAVAAVLRQPDPSEFEGAWVLPLTAHSNVLKRFAGGDGQVALHGRGGASLLDPLGSARSHGCVRLANPAIAWIATHVPAGTEVLVR